MMKTEKKMTDLINKEEQLICDRLGEFILDFGFFDIINTNKRYSKEVTQDVKLDEGKIDLAGEIRDIVSEGFEELKGELNKENEN